MTYKVLDSDGGQREYKTLLGAFKFVYSDLTAYMRRWPELELEIRYIWTNRGEYGRSGYVGRIRYRGSLFTYYRGKGNAVYKLNPNGKLSALTDKERKIIYKVENDEKNW